MASTGPTSPGRFRSVSGAVQSISASKSSVSVLGRRGEGDEEEAEEVTVECRFCSLKFKEQDALDRHLEVFCEKRRESRMHKPKVDGGHMSVIPIKDKLSVGSVQQLQYFDDEHLERLAQEAAMDLLKIAPAAAIVKKQHDDLRRSERAKMLARSKEGVVDLNREDLVMAAQNRLVRRSGNQTLDGLKDEKIEKIELFEARALVLKEEREKAEEEKKALQRKLIDAGIKAKHAPLNGELIEGLVNRLKDREVHDADRLDRLRAELARPMDLDEFINNFGKPRDFNNDGDEKTQEQLRAEAMEAQLADRDRKLAALAEKDGEQERIVRELMERISAMEKTTTEVMQSEVKLEAQVDETREIQRAQTEYLEKAEERQLARELPASLKNDPELSSIRQMHLKEMAKLQFELDLMQKRTEMQRLQHEQAKLMHQMRQGFKELNGRASEEDSDVEDRTHRRSPRRYYSPRRGRHRRRRSDDYSNYSESSSEDDRRERRRGRGGQKDGEKTRAERRQSTEKVDDPVRSPKVEPESTAEIMRLTSDGKCIWQEGEEAVVDVEMSGIEGFALQNCSLRLAAAFHKRDGRPWSSSESKAARAENSYSTISVEAKGLDAPVAASGEVLTTYAYRDRHTFYGVPVHAQTAIVFEVHCKELSPRTESRPSTSGSTAAQLPKGDVNVREETLLGWAFLDVFSLHQDGISGGAGGAVKAQYTLLAGPHRCKVMKLPMTLAGRMSVSQSSSGWSGAKAFVTIIISEEGKLPASVPDPSTVGGVRWKSWK